MMNWNWRQRQRQRENVETNFWDKFWDRFALSRELKFIFVSVSVPVSVSWIEIGPWILFIDLDLFLKTWIRIFWIYSGLDQCRLLLWTRSFNSELNSNFIKFRILIPSDLEFMPSSGLRNFGQPFSTSRNTEIYWPHTMDSILTMRLEFRLRLAAGHNVESNTITNNNQNNSIREYNMATYGRVWRT